jgi:hypothetical protein
MGEESFGSPEHMNDEQLEGRLEYMLDEKQKLDDEVNQRAIWQVLAPRRPADAATGQ